MRVTSLQAFEAFPGICGSETCSQPNTATDPRQESNQASDGGRDVMLCDQKEDSVGLSVTLMAPLPGLGTRCIRPV